MNKAIFEMYFGKRIIVQWEHEIGEPKRKHKKKRIAKKWLKKYGVWTKLEGACPKGYALFADNTWFVSRSLYVKMKNLLSSKPKIFHFSKLGHHGNNYTRY